MEVTKEIILERPKKLIDYRFLVISLGTGSRMEKKYDTNKASKWGVLGWLTSDGSCPLVDMFFHSNADIVDFCVPIILQRDCSVPSINYLRIQVGSKA